MAAETAKLTSDIISRKYPDLSEDFDPQLGTSTNGCSTPRPSRSKWPFLPHADYLELDKMNQMADMFASDDYQPIPYLDEAAEMISISITPLRAERLSSMLHVRTTLNKGRRGARAAADSKRPRPRHNPKSAGLKHTLLRLCRGRRSISDKSAWPSPEEESIFTR